ncbi:hypothetical protein TRICI_000095 [Trichomonascus ciferrii]|uniref:NAD(P)-binding domain-containing protein n=1 Tax=Trichomonascus ciferrii TaxID=44093 RepID=A0A642VEI8_9ASCO|nr:hypothetical protein TRICI_000095 [Trichomonascus ciferrii]
MKSLVVLGGTGYLGRHIVRNAVEASWKVTTISTKGVNDLGLSGVEHHKGNVFQPESYTGVLENADAVVHSMGIIMENPVYKDVINGNMSLCDVVKGPNPMEKQGAHNNNTFERLNRDSAIILAKEFAKYQQQDSRKPFVFISAEDWNPLASRKYIATKREAEAILERDYSEKLRPVFVRPGFMYEDNNPTSLRNQLGTMANLFGMLGSRFHHSITNPALSVDIVAKAVVESLQDDSIEGVVNLDALQEYAKAA